MTFKSNGINLSEKIQACKVLCDGDIPKVIAIGPFKDNEDETVFGRVEVIGVKNELVTFIADGCEYKASVFAIEEYEITIR